MCVLQPCALPTGVGVWWRDDSNFVQYGEAHAYIIKEGLRNKLRSVDLGTITSKVHPKGARYTADLSKMEQVAVSSGQKRDIVIVEPPGLAAPLGSQLGPAPMLDNKPANQGPSFTPKLHFRDSSGQLRQYGAELTTALLNCIAGGQQRKMVLQDSSCGKYLLFDIEEMKQFVVSHFNGENGGEPVADKTPPVEVILEIPWNPVAMVAIAKTADNYARRELLVMFVDRFRSEQHLDVALSNKALPRNVLAKKIDSSLTIGHPAYERFLDSLDTVATTIPNGLELLLKQSDPLCDDAEASIMKLAFKPASKSESQKAAFWTSMLAPVAAAHAMVCARAVEIVFYFVILPEANRRKANRSQAGLDHVIIYNPDHRLCLGELTVK